MQILWRLKLIKTFFTLKSNYKSLNMELLTLHESSWVYYVMATHPISLSGFFQSVKTGQYALRFQYCWTRWAKKQLLKGTLFISLRHQLCSEKLWYFDTLAIKMDYHGSPDLSFCYNWTFWIVSFATLNLVAYCHYLPD